MAAIGGFPGESHKRDFDVYTKNMADWKQSTDNWTVIVKIPGRKDFRAIIVVASSKQSAHAKALRIAVAPSKDREDEFCIIDAYRIHEMSQEFYDYMQNSD